MHLAILVRPFVIPLGIPLFRRGLILRRWRGLWRRRLERIALGSPVDLLLKGALERPGGVLRAGRPGVTTPPQTRCVGLQVAPFALVPPVSPPGMLLISASKRGPARCGTRFATRELILHATGVPRSRSACLISTARGLSGGVTPRSSRNPRSFLTRSRVKAPPLVDALHVGHPRGGGIRGLGAENCDSISGLRRGPLEW